ncbi:YphA family membrane protein [Brevibacillus ginsengisoli]|uniref:YphA family membrane protein n=1 Tax=Brevibacillus ginsengisoli TaxID=363854 RepID=UPI003CF01FAE
MNDGILAMIVQWTLLVCIWMGSFDRQLNRLGLARASALAVLTVVLVCSYASWQLYFLPVYVNVSGGILPFLLSGWIWMKLPAKGKEYTLASSVLLACVILFIRKLIFWDPVLLILDEELLIPIACLFLVFLLSRRLEQQWFLLIVSVPLADVFYVFSNLQALSRYSQAVIGSPEAQDRLWISISLWIITMITLAFFNRFAAFSRKSLQVLFKWKSKTEPNR